METRGKKSGADWKKERGDMSFFSTPVIVRPEVGCTFGVMDACDSLFEGKEDRKECREGARDAHLDPGAVYMDETRPYTTGKAMTYSLCSGAGLPTIVIDTQTARVCPVPR